MNTGGSTNTAAVGGIGSTQGTPPASVKAIPVTNDTMSDAEFKQMNNGWTREDVNALKTMKSGFEGAGAIAAKGFGGARPMASAPTAQQGFQFAKDLYTIKR